MQHVEKQKTQPGVQARCSGTRCTYKLTGVDESNPNSFLQPFVRMPATSTRVYLGGEKRAENKGSFLSSGRFNTVFALGESHYGRSVC